MPYNAATALTAGRDDRYKQTIATWLIPMYTGTIYVGGMVCINAAGYAVAAADVAGYTFAGVAQEDPDNAVNSTITNAGDPGDMFVKVRKEGRFVFDRYEPEDQSMLDACCYVRNDQTVAVDAANVTQNIAVGVVTQLPATMRPRSPHNDIATDECEVELMVACRAYTTPTTTTTAAATTTTAAVTTTVAATTTTAAVTTTTAG